MKMIFEKCPFKENGKLSKLFCLLLWGLIPHRTKSCRVSDPVEQDPAGYQTPKELSLVGYQAPQ
jgi:hypothetical protein